MSGPVESREWPNTLLARAVGPGQERRIFGYDAERDLAKHYAFSDALLLGLTGELPDEPRARAFAIALTFASPMSVAEAPMHAAVLARVCGVRTGGTLAIAMLALGEQVESLLRRLEPLFAPGSAGASAWRRLALASNGAARIRRRMANPSAVRREWLAPRG